MSDCPARFVNLRDPAYRGEVPVTMHDEDRTALTVAADRERARIYRGPWYDRAWARVAIISSLIVGIANVWATFARR